MDSCARGSEDAVAMAEAGGLPAVDATAFASYLEGEKRMYLTRVDHIDHLMGRKPRRVRCPNCQHVFDPKRSEHQLRRSESTDGDA